MAYISTEQVKEIRTELKNQFPNAKFSIKREHYSGVRIAVLASNVDFGIDYKQVNEYYINEHYSGDQAALLSKVYDIASKGTTWRETCDYGSQPSHYVWITIGAFDKTYQVKN
jgi:hypothetical protein